MTEEEEQSILGLKKLTVPLAYKLSKQINKFFIKEKLSLLEGLEVLALVEEGVRHVMYFEKEKQK